MSLQKIENFRIFALIYKWIKAKETENFMTYKSSMWGALEFLPQIYVAP